MGLAPEPKWLRLARNVKIYGVEAVFGRSILYEYEMDLMRTSRFLWEAYRARKSSENWADWNKHNPDAARALDWAGQEFEKCQT